VLRVAPLVIVVHDGRVLEVDLVSDDWGVGPTDAGKQLWFRLCLPV
jgi:hypothetical protein